MAKNVTKKIFLPSIDIPLLITKYYTEVPDSEIKEQRIIFGTSGHRGTSLNKTFNEWHILAITEAICLYREKNNINGPLFLGIDTHALSFPAYVSAIEILVAHAVTVMIAETGTYTPTPVISHAILKYNQKRLTGLADGIIMTPSHNPPNYGGCKYNPPSGGPADIDVTNWIETTANEILNRKLTNVRRIRYELAIKSKMVNNYDFLNNYVEDIRNVIDVDLLHNSNIKIGIDPLGGAGIYYWEAIAYRYHLNLTVINTEIDPTFKFLPLDYDGEKRMDPASPLVIEKLLKTKDSFHIAFASDADHDRHGIVTPSVGLLPPNHYLSIAIFYLLKHRGGWHKHFAIGKNIVTTEMIDYVARAFKRDVLEFPVGFKWFVDGLQTRRLVFCSESSSGAVFNRLNGDLWTTDKDGITLGLLAAEMTAKYQCDIAEIYESLEKKFGPMYYGKINEKADFSQKQKLIDISPEKVKISELAGSPINKIITKAPANHASIGGLKVISQYGWFVVRASGTEPKYEICAESHHSDQHLKQILLEATQYVEHLLNE